MNFFQNTAAGQGQQQQQQQQPQQPSLFANTTGSAPAAGGGPFGNTNTATNPSAGGGLFGNTGANAAPAAPAAPTGGLFGGAGTNNAPSGGLFGNMTSTPNTGGTGLFGGAPNTTPAANTATAATPAPPVGGFFAGFGQSKPAEAPKPAGASIFGQPATTAANTSSTPAPAPSLFGNTPASTAATATGTTPAPAPAGGSVFGGSIFGKKPDAPAAGTTPAAGAGTTGAGGSLFGQPPATTTGAASTPGGPFGGGSAKPAAAPSSGGLFGNTGASTTTGTTSTGGGLFGGAAGAATGSTPAPTGGLFGAPANKPEEKKDGAAPAAPAASAFGLFGAKKDDDKKEAPKAGAAPTAPSAAGPSGTAAAPNVSVPAPSMLKGKSIDEIVGDWFTQLEVQVKEFERYASEVSIRDRALIESGNNLSALYAALLAAEREQDDIDRTFDHIEQQQRDLAGALDAYEKVTDEILGSSGGGAMSSGAPNQSGLGGAGSGGGLRALDTGPADTERDRNYMLATELHGHLDDLSTSLTQMIEVVNTLTDTPSAAAPSSATPLSSTSIPSMAGGSVSASTAGGNATSEDPLTQIAQVLSNHLESLQWIDGAVKEVEAKVVDVEKRVRNAGGAESVSSPRAGYSARSRR